MTHNAITTCREDPSRVRKAEESLAAEQLTLDLVNYILKLLEVQNLMVFEHSVHLCHFNVTEAERMSR